MAVNNEDILDMASQRLGIDKEKIKDNNGENLLNSLSSSDKQKVSQVLSNPEMTKKVLSSQKAQELLKKFFGEK